MYIQWRDIVLATVISTLGRGSAGSFDRHYQDNRGFEYKVPAFQLSQLQRHRAACSASMSVPLHEDLDGYSLARNRGKVPRVLGLGSSGVDFIALVDRYPAADAKVRTRSLDIMGGGNCGNTLVGISRLGLDAALASKVGNDGNGRLILEGLEREGVDTSHVIVSEATPSAFTYIIVDAEGATRTCIHTPQTEDILPSEITPALLEGVSLVHLDSRHTPAAIALAQLANERNILVVVDAEKDRPWLGDLLPLADYLVCNKNFPQAFTGRSSREQAMGDLLSLGRAKVVVSTLGAEGCVVVSRAGSPPWEGFDNLSVSPLCPMHIKGHVERYEEQTSSTDTESTLTRTESKEVGQKPLTDMWVVQASSWPVEASSIVDTTGAGDAFIAAFVRGIVDHSGLGRMVALSSLVAAKKLSMPGARAGIPTVEEIAANHSYLLDS